MRLDRGQFRHVGPGANAFCGHQDQFVLVRHHSLAFPPTFFARSGFSGAIGDDDVSPAAAGRYAFRQRRSF